MKKNLKKDAGYITMSIIIDIKNKIENKINRYTFVVTDNEYVTLSNKDLPSYYYAYPVIGQVKGDCDTFIQGVRIGADNYLLNLYDFKDDTISKVKIVGDKVFFYNMDLDEGITKTPILGKVRKYNLQCFNETLCCNSYKELSTKLKGDENISKQVCKTLNSNKKYEHSLYKEMFTELKDDVRTMQLTFILRHSWLLSANLLTRSSYIMSKIKHRTATAKFIDKLLFEDDYFLNELHNLVQESYANEPFTEFDN